MKRKKVLFVTPPYHAGVVESAGNWPPLGFIYMAGAVRKSGFEPIIYDAMTLFHEMEDISRFLEEQQPDYICTTAFTSSFNAAMAVLDLARKACPEAVTIIGGVHPSFCYGEILGPDSAADYCVIGEGEDTLPALLTCIEAGDDPGKVKGIAFFDGNGVRKTNHRKFISNLDLLEPAWDLVNWKDYSLYFIDDSTVAILSSSRGCIHRCSFCSQHKFWHGTYRERNPDTFVAEIEHLFRTYGVNVFFLADEYPTCSRDRWDRILELLIRKDLGVHLLIETCVRDIIRDQDILEKYRRAGVLFIYMGVEATNNQRLEVFRKDIRFEDSKNAIRMINEAGMISESSVILGTPDETPETIRETFELAREYGPDFMHFLMLAPWPYADMYEDLKPFIEEWDYSKYNLVVPVIKPKNMTRDEVFREVLNCYRRYYSEKLPRWFAMRGNDLKRSCLLNGMKAIMKNSFLKEHMNSLGKMPITVEEYVKNI